MQTHRMTVEIPEDHQLHVSVPESIKAGTAELLFIVPPEARGAEVLAPGDRGGYRS